MISRAASVTVLCLVFMLLGCTTPQQEPTADAAQVAQPSPPISGADLFADNCAVCHGANAQGQPDWHKASDEGVYPPPPLNGEGHTWHHPDGLLYRIVNEGGATLESPDVPGFKSAMPAFGNKLTHDEIIAVIEHVKSLWAGKEKLGFAISESQALVSQDNPYPASASPYHQPGEATPEPASSAPRESPTPATENAVPTPTPAPRPTYTPRPPPTQATADGREPNIPFEAETIDGSQFNLEDTIGTPTLIAFWAPW